MIDMSSIFCFFVSGFAAAVALAGFLKKDWSSVIGLSLMSICLFGLGLL